MDTFSTILQEFGLTHNQIGIYRALIESRAQGASTLSRKTGIKRLSVYAILDSLREKGFVTTFKKDNLTYWSALDPETLITMCEKTISHEKKKQRALEEWLKKFKNGKAAAQKRPQVKFYEGVEGMKKAYEETLNAKEDILAYACVDEFEKHLKDFFPEYYRMRTSRGIAVKCITPKTPRAEIERKKDAQEMRTTAFIPPDEYYFVPEINIYDDKLLIISFKEKMGIVIESEEIANTMKKIFRLSWREAERLDAKTNGASRLDRV